jgi:hypothetical protein
VVRAKVRYLRPSSRIHTDHNRDESNYKYKYISSRHHGCSDSRST